MDGLRIRSSSSYLQLPAPLNGNIQRKSGLLYGPLVTSLCSSDDNSSHLLSCLLPAWLASSRFGLEITGPFIRCQLQLEQQHFVLWHGILLTVATEWGSIQVWSTLMHLDGILPLRAISSSAFEGYFFVIWQLLANISCFTLPKFNHFSLLLEGFQILVRGLPDVISRRNGTIPELMNIWSLRML